jgi:hypothetical protein
VFASSSIALAIKRQVAAPSGSPSRSADQRGSRSLFKGFAAVGADHEDCGAPDVFFGDHGGEKSGLEAGDWLLGRLRAGVWAHYGTNFDG